MNQAWEYKILDFFPSEIAKRDGALCRTDMEQILNEYGEKGWEMTGVSETDTCTSIKVFLKRQKQ